MSLIVLVSFELETSKQTLLLCLHTKQLITTYSSTTFLCCVEDKKWSEFSRRKQPIGEGAEFKMARML